MDQTQQDERWLDVLSGKLAPQDLDERKAASLRRYFELRDQHAAPSDPQALKRMENMVLARLSANGPATTPRQAGLWQQFKAWLFPAGGGHPGRYAAVAAVALAAVAVPLAMRSGDQGDDDAGGMKSPGAVLGQEVVIYSPQPLKDAQEVLQALAQRGVPAQVSAVGEDQLLQARVPAAKVPDAQQGLASLGVVLPADGQLRVRFRKSP